MTTWPEKLIADIARRRCALVIGSGISRQAADRDGNKPPVWKQFLATETGKLPDSQAKTHIKEAISKGDFLHACEWLKTCLGDRWTEVLRQTFTEPKFHVSETHKLIARLDLRLNFSLNFDNILERAFDAIQDGSTVKKHYKDADISEFLRGTGRYLIKMHGSLDTPENIIFTQKEYSQARVKYAAFYEALNSALMTYTFLFLGTGIQDPDMNLLLENQNFSYTSQYPHYLLCAEGELHAQLKKSLRDNRNLEIIEYDKRDDTYSGLEGTLKELLDKVEPARENLLEDQQW